MDHSKRKFLKTILTGIAGYTLINKAYPISDYSKYLTKDKYITQNGLGKFPFYAFVKDFQIGEYIPKDQGGKFIQMEIIGTEEDEVIVNKIKNGVLQSIYGNPIDWIKFEKDELEKSFWLSRLYYMPSFGRMYYLNNDIASLNFAMKFLRKWYEENLQLAETGKTKYNWTDMQIASRCIHLSWFYFLGIDGLSVSDKNYIIDILENHSKVLLSHFGKQPLNEHNHQSHGALAMLYIGTLFPKMASASELVQTAIKILEHHIKNAFYEDGGNVEQMFGYYPFEAQLFRDTYLLCEHNNIPQPEGIEELMVKMYNFITIVQQPDNTMPPINDSYDTPSKPTLTTLANVLGDKTPTDYERSKFFMQSQFGIVRSKTQNNNSWYILANPAKSIGGHMHAGRLGFNFWYNNTPIIRDSGCCNYDDPLFKTWYRTSKAHNTVLIDGKYDAPTSTDQLWVRERETNNKITDFEKSDNFTFLRMHSPASEVTNSSVDWYRSAALINDKYLVLHDYFKASGKHNYELLFHFDIAQVNIKPNNVLSVIKDNTKMNFIPANSNSIEKIELEEGLISIEGITKRAPMVTYNLKGDGDLHSFIVFSPEGETPITVKESVNENGAGLQIKDNNGKTTTLLFPNSTSRDFSAFGKKTSKKFDVQ